VSRQRVVETAVAALGEQDPDRFWREVCPAFVGHPHDVSWCGGFALWCLRQVGLADWDWIPGRGFLFHLPITKAPQPGDILYIANLAHHGVVEEVHGSSIVSIDGNTMPPPIEGVTRKMRHRALVTAFYSISPLLGTPEVPIGTPPTLRMGATHADVLRLQRLLGVTADGAFGPRTYAAVIAFQAQHGLITDGVVGPITWHVLLNPPKGVA
jgi:hypothetical protein